MQLIDFNRSTADLHPGLALYWEHHDQRFAITDLQTGPHQLLLITRSGRPLTLDQLRARCQQVDPHAALFIAGTPAQRLYGYRLVTHLILLG